jgi:predicted ribosomally synthesized peptide with nif11-like leader
MSQESLAQFCQAVFFDPTLQNQLREITDRQEFTALAQQLGRVQGYEFTFEEIEERLNQGRRDWLERWF